MILSPVVLFAYNRPDLLRATLDSLAANELADQSALYIYCDGPKQNAGNDQLEKIKQVRKIASEKKWCSEVSVIESDVNKGLAKSVIGGVTEIINREGKVIVIEDDVLLSKYFLRFMNDALVKYENDDKVLSIGSWNYFCDPDKLSDNYFLRYPDSIAWGTFKRAWDLFEPNSSLLISKLKDKKLMDVYNCNIPEKYFERMLVSQDEGQIDSWAIRWTATSVLHEKVNFYPRYSLSKHIGFVVDATHESTSDDYNASLKLAEKQISITNQPVEESKVAISNWREFIETEFIQRKGIIPRTIQKSKSIILRVLNGLLSGRNR